MNDPALERISDEELRAEARRRGYEMQSKEFSEASKRLIRELPELRRRLEELEVVASAFEPKRPAAQTPPIRKGRRRFRTEEEV